MTAPKKPARHLQPSDLQAVVRLATDATHGVTGIVEGVHRSVLDTLGAPGGAAPGRTSGITGLVYRSIGAATQLVGQGLDAALVRLLPLLAADGDAPATPEREAVLAALNGVMGDRLAASGNPLATRMSLRWQGRPVDVQALPPLPGAGGRLLLTLHGLCMNELQWQARHEGRPVDHGQALAAALDATALNLRYNSGLHVSQNGHELSARLEQLVANWPCALEQISVLAHSMGGLVIRSAIATARHQGLKWPELVKHIVFLGTPHHGAPLERAGNWVDVVLGSTPYSAPFARLGQLRSAGITDLRYGLVLDSDWHGHDRFRRQPDRRTPVPLPHGVACFTLAATTAAQRSALADRLLGDGLVPLHSALGEHDEPARCLLFPQDRQFIAYRMSHLELLSRPEVTRQLLQWLPGIAAEPGAPPRVRLRHDP